LKQVSITHWPAYAPKLAQTRPAGHVTLKQGLWQPFCPLHAHSGVVTQPGASVPAGAQITPAVASTTV
jgi:hypothetical protein